MTFPSPCICGHSILFVNCWKCDVKTVGMAKLISYHSISHPALPRLEVTGMDGPSSSFVIVLLGEVVHAIFHVSDMSRGSPDFIFLDNT